MCFFKKNKQVEIFSMKNQPHPLSALAPTFAHTSELIKVLIKETFWPLDLCMGCSLCLDRLPSTSAGEILVHPQDSFPDGPCLL